MAQRFSKTAVGAALTRRMVSAAQDFKQRSGREIDPRNGYAQCRGLTMECAVAYGTWRALFDFAEEVRAGEVVS